MGNVPWNPGPDPVGPELPGIPRGHTPEVAPLSVEVADVVAIGTTVASLIPEHPVATDRQCIITISNHSLHTLFNPRSYVNSGGCTMSLPHQLPPGHECTVAFQKREFRRGSCGVVAYELHPSATTAGPGGCTKQVAYMFNVPFDYNMYKNYHAGGIFDEDKSSDKDLWGEMLCCENNEEFTRAKGGKESSHSQGGFKVVATMTNEPISVCTVKVYDSSRVIENRSPVVTPRRFPRFLAWFAEVIAGVKGGGEEELRAVRHTEETEDTEN